MVLAAYEYVEERGSGSQSTSRPWPVTSSEWSGHGWTRCWSGRLPWRPLPPMHEATGAVASPLMPTRTGVWHTTTTSSATTQAPTGTNQIPRLTALTPQNQPERPLLRGNQFITSSLGVPVANRAWTATMMTMAPGHPAMSSRSASEGPGAGSASTIPRDDAIYHPVK